MSKDRYFVPYDESFQLQRLSYSGPNFGCYIEIDNSKVYSIYEITDPYNVGKIIDAPLWDQAFEWFWERHKIFADFFVDDEKTIGFMISYFDNENRTDKKIQYKFKNFYQAKLTCLRNIIILIENKNQ